MPLKDLVRESTDLIEQLCIEAALELTGDNRASARAVGRRRTAQAHHLVPADVGLRLRRRGLRRCRCRTAGWLVVVGILLAGPLVCATSQAVNDWFDRHVDAINEPHRPIPSGRMPGRWGLYIAIAWTVLSLLAWGALLGPWGFAAAALGLLLAWAYSAPPLRLKRNGWWGNAACGLSYEGLAWITGAAVMAGGAMPEARSLAAGAAVQPRRARHHDAERLQGDRGRPPHGHRLAAGAAGPDGAARAAC
jgi:chlorophyll/bacteriochlorophyll a synthase